MDVPRGRYVLRTSAVCGLRITSSCCEVRFRRKDRTGSKTLSYTAVLEVTKCKRIETTIRKRQLWFAGALARQREVRLPRRLMNGRLPARGPKESIRPPPSNGTRGRR